MREEAKSDSTNPKAQWRKYFKKEEEKLSNDDDRWLKWELKIDHWHWSTAILRFIDKRGFNGGTETKAQLEWAVQKMGKWKQWATTFRRSDIKSNGIGAKDGEGCEIQRGRNLCTTRGVNYKQGPSLKGTVKDRIQCKSGKFSLK